MTEWIWTTLRKATYKHTMPEGANPTLVAMGLVSPEHNYESHVDHPALLNLEEGCMFYEAAEETKGVPPCTMFVPMTGHDETIMLADTLDEIALKLGAPPRPKIEVPAAFRGE